MSEKIKGQNVALVIVHIILEPLKDIEITFCRRKKKKQGLGVRERQS